MIYIATTPFAKTRRPAVEITYKAVAYAGTQARLVGREMLVPEIDLADWSCKAVVDWLDVEFTFGQRTQPQHIQKVLRKNYRADRETRVDALNAGPDRTSESFVIRFQEPNRRRFNKAMKALKEKFGIVADRITAIEVGKLFAAIQR
jgi:hypothetical protein